MRHILHPSSFRLHFSVLCLLASVLCLLSSVLCPPASALTDAWSVDVRQHAAVQRTYKQGESHDISITLRDGLRPLALTNATARFYWYTNAVDNLWWTNTASVTSSTVSVSWTPSMDVGASSYAYWVGIWQAGATSPLWRVTGTIRMLPSPGFVPNALLPPVRTLDFAVVTLTNAPWVTAADWSSASNALASAITNLNLYAVPADGGKHTLWIKEQP